MTPDEIIYHRRVRVMEHAKATSVSQACRVFGVSRTTFYRWHQRVQAYGLDALMPKGRRAPAMPNATPSWVVEELLVEVVVYPTLGARRYVDALAGRGFQLSVSGVQKILNRHQLGRRRQRVGALAQLTAATTDLIYPFSDAKKLVELVPRGRLLPARMFELRVTPRRLTGEIATFLDEIGSARNVTIAEV